MVPLFGQRSNELVVDGFRVSETSHAGALPEHAHASACFCLVIDGGFAEHAGSRASALGRGELILRAAGAPHADRFDRGGARCLNIEYSGDAQRDDAAVDALLDPCATAIFAGGPAVWRATQVRAALLAGDALALADACWALVDACRPIARESAPRWLRAIDDAIANRATEPWSLAALAALVDVHPAHLSRAYRAAHGTSIVQALHRARVAAAAQQLARVPSSLGEVAAACGFYDQPHFTRTFRRHTGLTPAAYRAAARSDRTRRRAR